MKRYPIILILLSLVSVFNTSSAAAWMSSQQAANHEFTTKTGSSILQTNTITQFSPVSCPPSGCAAGQRLNFQATFDVSPDTNTPNVQVCFYSSTTNWINTTSLSINTPGWTAGDSAGICNGTPFGSANSTLSIGTSSLNLSFRINATSVNPNTLIVSVYQLVSGNWKSVTTLTYTNSTSILSASSPAFVANDADSCAGNSPCYINSGDDQPGGIGTGLKDAVDALPTGSTINILGSYSIKGSSVDINNGDIIQGVNNSSITTTSSFCTNNALLQISKGATLQNLNVTSPCNTRDLLAVSSPDPVTVQSNDLTGGNNGVLLSGNNGNVLVRFSQIQGNKGYGILRSSGNGPVQAVANNIYGNRAGAQVDCAQNGQADHNFWGSGVSTSTAVANCIATNGKQLGAQILLNSSSPGVDARKLTVTGSKNSIDSLGISVQHDSGNDFDVYIVNHGIGSTNNIPFYGNGTDYITACGNFLDVFLADSNASPANLSLFFRYNLNQSCTATISSPNFCGQSSDSAKYPLWWYDPQNNMTNLWDTTGQNPAGTGANGATGQTTTCLQDSNEIKVSISNSGRPGFQDLNFTPFIAGFYPVGFLSFAVQVNVAQATIQWETSYETGISRFYLVRSLQANGTYSRIYERDNMGNETTGGSYYYVDPTLSFGKTYYYKLELIGANGNTLGFYGPVSAITATATPTITPTFTRTITPTITITRTPTQTFTLYVYHSPTPTLIITRTYTPYPTSTFLATNTPVPTSTMENLSTPSQTTNPLVTPLPTNNGYPDQNATQIAMVTQNTQGNNTYPVGTSAGTNGPSLTTTATPPSTGNENGTFWVSLVTGGVLGILVLGAAGWFLFQRRIIH